MKKVLILCFSILLFAGSVLTAQPVDSSGVTPGTEVVQPVEQSTAYTFMLAAAILGVVIRVFYSTIKGIKNPDNNSPTKFDALYWLKDNALPKLTTTIVFILTFAAPLKLPDSYIGIGILSLVAFIGGLFIDYVTDILKSISPKISR